MSATYSLSPAAEIPAGSLKVACTPSRGIVVADAAGAGECAARLRGDVDHFDFVVVRVGDVELAVVKHDAERMLQPHFGIVAIDVAKIEKRAGHADDRRRAAVESNGTARIALPSLSATNSCVPSDARPLGWAKDAKPVAYGSWRQQRAVDDVFAAVAGVGADFAVVERHFPNLMRRLPSRCRGRRRDATMPKGYSRRLISAAPTVVAAASASGQLPCSPVPATVVTCWAARSTLRSK